MASHGRIQYSFLQRNMLDASRLLYENELNAFVSLVRLACGKVCKTWLKAPVAAPSVAAAYRRHHYNGHSAKRVLQQ